ncbi:hypothetical protein ACOXXX_01390 [Thalassococcus sp. BH17M4-6]|uniref:hypothetical protein n=1 Tax=Thalassococcus sp. BH17M4-6 TaxID=3413148 RepID=UPI003BC15ADA
MHRLAGFYATILAIDDAAPPLEELARAVPGWIEPLALALETTHAADVLTEAWGSEPVHLCIDLSALQTARSLVSRQRQLLGLAAALAQGLAAGAGRGIVAVPVAGPQDSADRVAESAALQAFVARMPGYADPARLIGLQIPMVRGNWSPARCVDVGDLVLMLGHPVSRGLAPYQTVTSRL